ncbi:MAG: SDR family NAD(P)-dependent oxidoreductase [Candidatus Tectimicrobiota bacterium]
MSAEHLEQLFGLRGKVALVTGASSGLGIEFARGLAMAGAAVALVARRQERLQAVAEQIKMFGVRTLAVPTDLRDVAQIDAALQHIEQTLGPVDILVNNAGVAPVGRAERHTLEKWQQAIEINLTAVFVCCQKVGQQMIARGQGGRIINISSVLGEGANAVHKTVGYAATKGAVTNMTRQLAVEWAPYGITVNALAPSWFPTEMITDPRLGRVHDEQQARMELFTPMGRLGKEGEVMGALIFLASPAASYITGTVVHIDGGWRAW